MIDYHELYMILVQGITDAVRSMDRQDYNAALHILIKAQQKAEERYITAEEPSYFSGREPAPFLRDAPPSRETEQLRKHI